MYYILHAVIFSYTILLAIYDFPLPTLFKNKIPMKHKA